jgi:peptidyl-prolyl cis-trans isomerase SurA
VLSGEKFADLVKKFSDDKGSAQNGGALPWFTCNRLVPEFILTVYNLKDTGMVAKPVLTSYGWHIIKLLDRKAIGTYEDNKADLKQKIVKDMRHDKSKESVIARLKSEYSYIENPKALAAFYKVVTDSILNAKWKVEEAAKLRKKLFTLNGVEYTQQAFATYLAKNQKKEKAEPIESYVNRKYKSFVDETVLAYEDTQLERKYEDFRLIVNEYRDGILLFDLTQRKVWDKAVKDTTGLEAFFETVRSNYIWDERKEAIIVTFKNLKSAKEGDELLAMANDLLLKDKLSFDKLKQQITTDSTYSGIVELEKVVKGEDEMIDNLVNVGQIQKKVTADGAEKFVATLAYLNRMLPPTPKDLSEVKGLVTAEYQNFLEKEWIKELRAKYPFTVDKQVLESIK